MVSVGDVIDGTVEAITGYGLFVTDCDGNMYLLGLHELWWDRRGLPCDFASVGDCVTFMVTKIDLVRGANLGSPKRASPELDAWRDPTRFAEGVVFEGTVTDVMSYGAYVEHPAGVQALLHESTISDNHSFALGDRLKVEIIASNQESRKLRVKLVN